MLCFSFFVVSYNIFSSIFNQCLPFVCFSSSRFAFVSFGNETECTEALNAHKEISGEKVNVSYAFAQVGKQNAQTNNESNKNQEQKSTNKNNQQDKTPNKQIATKEKEQFTLGNLLRETSTLISSKICRTI